MEETMIAIAGTIFAALSAVCWIAAALIFNRLPMYPSGPQKWVVDRIKVQSWCNGVVAFFAALAAVCANTPIRDRHNQTDPLPKFPPPPKYYLC